MYEFCIMSDSLSPSQRHFCMSRIRSKNTRPEMLVRRFLYKNGIRYRIHVKSLPGTPDVAIPSLRTCIFINGCFWHGHDGCSLYTLPKTNVAYWSSKIKRNRERDLESMVALKKEGWHTIVVWECQLKKNKQEETFDSLLRTLNVIHLENLGARYTYNINEEDEGAWKAAED